VIVQEMIQAEWSGVAFSINPVTGRNETVIEGVRGSGSQLVQEGLTPERWIYHQGSWEHYSPSNAPPAPVLKEIVDGIHQLRKSFGSELDVEWCWDGSKLYYLQCRSVTTSKYPTIYSNHISREVLPGMIKPLVWSINIPVVNSAWLRLLGKMLGKLDIMPEQLSRAFYYRAYFNMGTLGALFKMMGMPRDSLESLMGRKDPSGKSSFKPGLRTMKYLPGMLWFLLSNLNLGRKFERKIQELNQESAVLEQELENFSLKAYRELFERLHALAREMAYWNIIIPLTMQITSRILQRKIEKKGAYFSQIDFTQDFPELLNHDPHIHLKKLHGKWISFPDEMRQGIPSYQDLVGLDQSHPLSEVREELNEIIARFGHFSESGNDFSYTPWREDPGFVFDLMKEQPGQEQMETGITKEERNGDTDEAGEKADKKITKNGAYKRAGRYRLYREMISSSYTRTYGLFRKLFLQTGQHFTAQQLLSEPEQVFYLSLEEHDKLLETLSKLLEGSSPSGVSELSKKADQVKREMETYAELSLPAVIYGETPPPIPAPDETIMKGIPTSPGIFEGEIVVVKGSSHSLMLAGHPY
jgi:pyruvate,water dikinase